MTRSVADLVLAAVVVCAVLAACLGVDCRGEAQDRPSLVATVLARQKALVLGRVGISEGGWAESDVFAAYHTALISGAPDAAKWDLHAQRYTRLFDAHRPPPRIWLLGLGESDAKPIGFPSQLPWRTARDRHGEQLGRLGYLDRWHAAIDVAAELVANPRNPCVGVPTDWASGARVAVYRAHHPQAVEIDCPGSDTFLCASPAECERASREWPARAEAAR